MSISPKTTMVRSNAVQRESMEFRNTATGFGVWLSAAAIDTIFNTAFHAGRRETGGILIGRYDAEGWMAEIVEATSKPRGSRSGWWWFKRGTTGLRELLAARWTEGCHYLGEWHYHPGGSPAPSDTDIASMREISADPVYQCSEPILVIIGGRPPRQWNLSVSVVRRDTLVSLSHA